MASRANTDDLCCICLWVDDYRVHELDIVDMGHLYIFLDIVDVSAVALCL